MLHGQGGRGDRPGQPGDDPTLVPSAATWRHSRSGRAPRSGSRRSNYGTFSSAGRRTPGEAPARAGGRRAPGARGRRRCTRSSTAGSCRLCVSAGRSGYQRTTCTGGFRGKVWGMERERRRARAGGEGSLYRRTRLRPDGTTYTRWVAQISLGGRDERRIVRRICETKAEAKDALVEMLKPVPPTPPQQLQPLGAYLRRWLAESAAPSVSPNTLRGYEDALEHLGADRRHPARRAPARGHRAGAGGDDDAPGPREEAGAGVTQDRPQRPGLPASGARAGGAARARRSQRRPPRAAAPGPPSPRRGAHAGARQGDPRGGPG